MNFKYFIVYIYIPIWLVRVFYECISHDYILISNGEQVLQDIAF